MTDAHVHLERGPYTIEWLNKFIHTAISNNISEIYFLEHTHRFIEFSSIYKGFSEYNEFQNNWYSKKNNERIRSYLSFVNQVKGMNHPIKLHFGLEVCYSPQYEEDIYRIKNECNLDFYTGSIHWIDNWAFDHKAEHWSGKNTDEVYIKYYESMIKLVKSGLFNHLAHPDSIKCFNNYPSIDLSKSYEQLAIESVKNNMKIEFSAGLKNNYNHFELGMNLKLLQIILANNANIITASDAHRPEDVGRNIKKCEKIIEENRRTIAST